MANGKSGTSVWKWMWILFVLWLPLIGLIMLIIWAIIDKNENRRNYYRARIAWWVVMTAFWITLGILGMTPQIDKWVNKQIISYAKTLEEPTKKPARDRPQIVF